MVRSHLHYCNTLSDYIICNDYFKFSGKARNSRQFNSIFEAVVFMGYVKETEETMMLKKTWDDVRKCRYLRGHEPEDMRIPEDENFTDFVFGKTQSSERN